MYYMQFYKYIHNEQNTLKNKGQVIDFFCVTSYACSIQTLVHVYLHMMHFRVLSVNK